MVSLTFQEYMGVVIKLLLDDFSMFSHYKLHLEKLTFFKKCYEFSINLKLWQMHFLVYYGIILRYIMSKESKLLEFNFFLAIMNMPPPKTPKDI
jgi:hypothetical protein